MGRQKEVGLMRSPTRVFTVAGVLAGLVVALSASSATAAISSLTVGPKAQLSPDRRIATITGTISCDDGDLVFVDASLSQTQGRTFAQATREVPVFCTGSPQSWSIPTSTFGVTWLPGRASVNVVTFDTFDTTGVGVHSTIVLSP
jgi:hypothetical protein